MIQPDEIIRSNRKTLSISVDSRGRLIVRAPLRCTKERIFTFLQAHEGWILKKQAQRKGAGIDLPPENLDGYTFLLLGEKRTIFLYEGKKIGYDGENQRLYVPRERGRERLVEWLKGNALRILTEVTQKESANMGATFRLVSISSARRRWGSCSYDDKIRYTFRLLYCPKEIIRYVVVHELAHTRHKNHSPLFWREVERYDPAWKEHRAWLKAHGGLLEIF